MKSGRLPGLDLVRTVAIIVVMITHTFNYTGLLSVNLRSASWTALAALKFTAIIGVPLFLLLTGFLQSKRTYGKKHFTSIIPVLLSYFAITAISASVEKIILNPETRILQYIVSILDFEYGYAWYVEMYIGLFLLIPFLNILYRNIDKKQKMWLIGILSFLSFIPASLQYVTVSGINFEIFPDFFTNLYVLAYYFIGAYIAEYRPSPKRIYCFGVLLITVATETALCYFLSSENYAWWLFNNVASVTHAIVAVCLFLMLYEITPAKILMTAAEKISICSFEMYLISYMTDYFCHTYLSIPLLFVFATDFTMAFIGANLIRSILVPAGKVIRKKICK